MENREKLRAALVSLLEASKSKESFGAMSERLKRKVSKGLAYSGITEAEFNEIRERVLNESVFDPVQETRSKDVFGEDEKMRPDVKKIISDRFEQWRSQLDFPLNVVKMEMIGSMTGFQYNSSSDIDVNVYTDLDEDNLAKARKILPNGNKLEGTNHDVNYWLGGKGFEYDQKKAENIYDIFSDTWVKKSDKKEIPVPYPYVMELARFFMNSFDLTISESERDMTEIDLAIEFKPEREEDIKARSEKISKKVEELKADLDSLKMGKHVLRSFMVEGFEGTPFKVSIAYEFEDPRLSMNSMVYKMLDRFGYMEKISSQIKKCQEKIDLAERELGVAANGKAN